MENLANIDKVEGSEYPSTGLAYEFAKLSYEWLINRFEAMNGRIQGLLTLGTAITVAVPVFTKAISQSLSFHSVWFYGAMAAYTLFALMGFLGLRLGKLTLVHPMKLYNDWLGDSPWEFQKNSIYFAGQHFQHNNKAIEMKNSLRDIMTIFLLAEVGCAIVWIAIAI